MLFFVAPKKQIIHNFLPFSTKMEVLYTGSTQEILERVVAVVSSTLICVNMFSSKPTSVCSLFNRRKEDLTFRF